MRNRKVEKYIPVVMEVLNSEFKNGEAPKEYNGYIASFGASVIQSGLKATVAHFENQQANTNKDRSYLVKIILDVLKRDYNNIKTDSLLRYILESKTQEDILKDEIIAIAIAIKLSLRTFKLV